MKHPDDLTKMWRDLMERRAQREREAKEQLAKAPDEENKKERNNDGRLPPTF